MGLMDYLRPEQKKDSNGQAVKTSLAEELQAKKKAVTDMLPKPAVPPKK